MKIMILTMLFSINVYAKDIIYHCAGGADSIMQWNYIKRKYLIDTSSHAVDSHKGLLTFVIRKKKATLKESADTVELNKIAADTYSEMTSDGNVNIWKIYPETANHPSILVVLKSYKLVNPFVVSAMYTCS